MKKIFLILTAVMLLCLMSCASDPKNVQLYKWYDYENASYKYLKNADDKSLENLIKTYEKIIYGSDGGYLNQVPPGVYADYGFFLMQMGDYDRGYEMIEREMELYPQSVYFLDSFLGGIDEE